MKMRSRITVLLPFTITCFLAVLFASAPGYQLRPIANPERCGPHIEAVSEGSRDSAQIECVLDV